MERHNCDADASFHDEDRCPHFQRTYQHRSRFVTDTLSAQIVNRPGRYCLTRSKPNSTSANAVAGTGTHA